MKPRLEIRFPLSSQWTFCFGRPYSPAADEFLLNHARSGILLALRALDLPAGSAVGVMAYNCHTVFNAISQAGYQPVFIDVTEELTLDRNDLKKKQASLKALVITHLFGILNDVAAIREEYPDLPLIEDCAHAYGLHTTAADFCVYSLGQGKLPSLGDGGILRVNERKHLVRLRSLYDSLPEYSSLGTLHLYLTMMAKALLNQPCIYPWFTKKLKSRRKLSTGIETISPRKMCRGIRALYECVRPDSETLIMRRRTQAMETNALLKGTEGILSVLEGSCNGFMAVARCEDVPAAKKALEKRGIEAETHFSHCLDWAKSFGYEEGSCPCAEALVGQLIMVPTYI